MTWHIAAAIAPATMAYATSTAATAAGDCAKVRVAISSVMPKAITQGPIWRSMKTPTSTHDGTSGSLARSVRGRGGARRRRMRWPISHRPQPLAAHTASTSANSRSESSPERVP
ncbi:hypothetical protein D3C81_1953350 [compost metagenome]